MLNAENVFSDLTPKKKTVLDAEHEPLGVWSVHQLFRRLDWNQSVPENLNCWHANLYAFLNIDRLACASKFLQALDLAFSVEPNFCAVLYMRTLVSQYARDQKVSTNPFAF